MVDDNQREGATIKLDKERIETPSDEKRRLEALEGKNAREIVAEAEVAWSKLAEFTIDRSRFRKVPQRYGRAKPRIDLEVTNNNRHSG